MSEEPTTIAAVAEIATALAAVGSTAYTISQGSPDAPPAPVLAAAPPAPRAQVAPPAASTNEVQQEEQKARQRANQRLAELQRRQSNASTVLSAPLGISSGAGAPTTTVLGR